MPTGGCSFEIHPPIPEAEIRPARVHPDPEVYARMNAVARVGVARRFALCRHHPDGPAGASNVFAEYFGWQYRDGVTITNRQGQPVGWYSSLDSAHHHLTEHRPTPLWLVWLEPDPATTATEAAAAATEAAHLEPAPFIIGIAFLATGPTDAQQHAIRLVETAETFLPEVQRQASMIASVRHGNHSLFCAQHGCVKPWQHTGDHHIPIESHPHHPPKVHPDDLDLPDDQRTAINHALDRHTDDDSSPDTASTDTD